MADGIGLVSRVSSRIHSARKLQTERYVNDDQELAAQWALDNYNFGPGIVRKPLGDWTLSTSADGTVRVQRQMTYFDPISGDTAYGSFVATIDHRGLPGKAYAFGSSGLFGRQHDQSLFKNINSLDELTEISSPLAVPSETSDDVVIWAIVNGSFPYGFAVDEIKDKQVVSCIGGYSIRAAVTFTTGVAPNVSLDGFYQVDFAADGTPHCAWGAISPGDELGTNGLATQKTFLSVHTEQFDDVHLCRRAL